MERVNTHDGGVEMDSLRQTDIESDATTPRNHIGPGQRLMRFSKKSVKQLKKMKIPFKVRSWLRRAACSDREAACHAMAVAQTSPCMIAPDGAPICM
eukprot:358180-Chlamydomonas_euryale.AAC.4